MIIRPAALLAVLLWIFAGLAASAQTLDFRAFDRFADSVETNIANDEIQDAGYEALRESLAEWRQKFLEGQKVNIVQINALEAQVDALGPTPPEGETEAENISARRETLRASLRDARAPRLSAIEAYARSDSLISQIDARLRDRQTDALLELRRTPLDPTLWPGAIAALGAVFSDIQAEITDGLTDPGQGQFWQRFAIAVLLLAAAVILILRGPRRIEQWLAKIESSTGEHGAIVYGFLLSFGGVLAAVAGISLINAALISTGILGETGRAMAIGVNAAILAYALGRWLGGRIFPERTSIPSSLILGEHERSSGRWYASSLGFLTGLLSLLGILHQTVSFDLDQLAVLTLPIFVLMGIVLFRLGRLIWLGGKAQEGEVPSLGNRVEQLVGRAVQLMAVAAPLAAMIGFFSLAFGVLYPAALSLGLLAFLIALHYVLWAGNAMMRHLDEDAAKQALFPVLASLGTGLASVPVFALIWGARNSDLGEIWGQFTTGIRLGETTISPGNFLTFAILFAIGYGLTRLVQGTLRSSVLPRTKIDKGGQNAITSGVGYLGLTIATIVGITSAGIDLSSFAIIIGALGVGIGFGLQNIVNNFVSGIILLIERPISEGDWVEVNGQMGIVQAISVRSTLIQTFDKTDVIVPNGDLISGTVTNWTRGDSVGRIIVPVGVAYGTDTRKVEGILREIAEANPLVSVNPPPTILFQGFGADSLDFEIRAILTDIVYGVATRSEINHEIARRFAEEGIEIPFAQRDIWLRNPEALEGNAASKRPPFMPIDPPLGGLEVDDPDKDKC